MRRHVASTRGCLTSAGIFRRCGQAILPVIYRAAMSNAADGRGYGAVFNEVADEYDRHRPTYPDALIDRACEMAGLGQGAPCLRSAAAQVS